MDDSSAKDAGKQVVPSPLRKGRVVYASATATGRGFASCAAKVIRASVAAGITDRRPGALPGDEEAILFGMPVSELAARIRRKNRLEGPTIEFGWRLVFLGECRRPKREHADVYLFFGGEDEEAGFVSTCGKVYAKAPRPIVMLVASQVRLSVEHLLLLKSRGMSAIRLTTRLAEKGWTLPLDQLLNTKSAARASRAGDQHSAAYCRVITHEGARTINRNQYIKLVKDRGMHDMFIDGMTGEAFCRRGKAKPQRAKLTPMEQGLLIDVVAAGNRVRPRQTETGSRSNSEESAVRLFQSARKKADMRLGRCEYRAFCIRTNAHGRTLKTFEFVPPDDLQYCVICPI